MNVKEESWDNHMNDTDLHTPKSHRSSRYFVNLSLSSVVHRRKVDSGYQMFTDSAIYNLRSEVRKVHQELKFLRRGT